MSEHEILNLIKSFKGYYNLDVVEISMTDKTFNLVGYQNGKVKKSFSEEIKDEKIR